MTAGVYEVGFGRSGIAAWEPGMPMLGWGVRSNRALGVAERLMARAAVLREPGGRPHVVVSLDLCFVTQLIRALIVDRLVGRHAAMGFCAHRVMLTLAAVRREAPRAGAPVPGPATLAAAPREALLAERRIGRQGLGLLRGAVDGQREDLVRR